MTTPGSPATDGLAEAFSFVFVRGFTPEQLIARMGAQPEDFSWMTFDEAIDAGGHLGGWTESVAVTAVGAWAFVVQHHSSLGADDEFIVPLSAGTRLVSLYRLDIKDLEEFRWVEDGEIRFNFWAQKGFSEVPDELVETMKRIDHNHCDLYQGPGPALIEHLTGVKLTLQLLEGSTYLSGVVKRPATA